MTDRTARITRISSVAGYVVAAAAVAGLASVGLSQTAVDPGETVNDLALLVMIGAIAPLMVAFYELGGRTPLRIAQLAQTLGWISVGIFVVVQLLVIAGAVTIDRDAGATGVVAVASLALGYIGLWIAGANLLAGPWLSAGRWLGVAAGLTAVVFAFGHLRGGADSGWTWIGGIGLLALGAAWAFVMARLLASRYRAGDGELG
jgi:hypothetical protein